MNCEKAWFVPWLTLIIVLSVAKLMMDSSRCPACRNYKVQTMPSLSFWLFNVFVLSTCVCIQNAVLGTVSAALWKSRKALQWTRRCTSWPRFNGPCWLRSKGTYLGIEYWIVGCVNAIYSNWFGCDFHGSADECEALWQVLHYSLSCALLGPSQKVCWWQLGS